jgi:hypothetical protein
MAYRSPHDLMELQLTPQERDKISAPYNLATYLPQRAEMTQAWADHVDTMRAHWNADALR